MAQMIRSMTYVGFKADAETIAAIDLLEEAQKRPGSGPVRSEAIRKALIEAAERLDPTFSARIDASHDAIVYGLVDPRDGIVKYVGQTTALLRDRLIGHLSGSTGIKKMAWIEELAAIGLKPSIEVLESVQPQDLDAAEKRWIEKLQGEGLPLTNARSMRAAR